MTSTKSKVYRKTFAKLAKRYEELKPFLNEEQRYSLEFQLRIAKFELNHPNTPYYIDQHLQPVKGILKSPYCKLCSKDLDKIRDENPRSRVIDFCSPKCRKEANRRRKIFENELKGKTTGGLWWNHPKDEKGNSLPLQRKDMFYDSRNGEELVRHYYRARKSKWAKI